MIVVLGGIKGGCGKTTLATNLTVIRALEGKKVLLVDADEQHSTSDWVEHRESLDIVTPWSTVQLHGPSVRTQLLKMKDDYDDIIIDTGGRDTTSQRAALTIADVFIAPFQPRSLDVWTVGMVAALLAEIHTVNPDLKAYAIINRADPQGRDNQDTCDILSEATGIHCLPFTIGQRKAFANAASEGLGVIELKTADSKAKIEINELKETIFDTALVSK